MPTRQNTLPLGFAARPRARRSKTLGSAGAVSLTNAQLKARSKPSLNAQLAEALEAAGYPVITFKEWDLWILSDKFKAHRSPFFVAEFPFAPARPTWDRRKIARPFEKARWQFEAIEAPRRWRWDFAWPLGRLCIDIQGATFVGGRHTRGTGYTRDSMKANEAEIDGWLVLKLDEPMIKEGVAIEIIQRAVRARQAG